MLEPAAAAALLAVDAE
jgi:hypothetical protein